MGPVSADRAVPAHGQPQGCTCGHQAPSSQTLPQA